MKRPGRPPLDEQAIKAQQAKLLTVKEYASVIRQHPLSVYRRIREGKQVGVTRIGGSIRLAPPNS